MTVGREVCRCARWAEGPVAGGPGAGIVIVNVAMSFGPRASHQRREAFSGSWVRVSPMGIPKKGRAARVRVVMRMEVEMNPASWAPRAKKRSGQTMMVRSMLPRARVQPAMSRMRRAVSSLICPLIR